MAGQLIPPSELAPPAPDHLTPTQRIALWMGVMNVCEQFLLAGLRREIGPNGDLRAAYHYSATLILQCISFVVFAYAAAAFSEFGRRALSFAWTGARRGCVPGDTR